MKKQNKQAELEKEIKGIRKHTWRECSTCGHNAYESRADKLEAELKGIQEGKLQALAEEMKFLESLDLRLPKTNEEMMALQKRRKERIDKIFGEKK
jgi:hypothetical protein